MSEEQYTLGDPVNHVAFQLGDLNPKPLTAMGLIADCKCGQRMAMVTGFNLDINVPDGQDLVARCRCGKEWSIAGQSRANKAKLEAMQAAAAAAGEQAAAIPAPDPAQAPETPPPAEVPPGEDPQAYNKSM